MRASRARAWWRWLRIHSELRPIAALGTAGLLALGFVELADDVRAVDRGATRPRDRPATRDQRIVRGGRCTSWRVRSCASTEHGR